MTPKGHGIIRGRRDILYDPKGHGHLCGLFDLAYDPKRSRGQSNPSNLSSLSFFLYTHPFYFHTCLHPTPVFFSYKAYINKPPPLLFVFFILSLFLFCRRDLLYDPKGHGDPCGPIDLVYHPKRSRGSLEVVVTYFMTPKVTVTLWSV